MHDRGFIQNTRFYSGKGLEHLLPTSDYSLIVIYKQYGKSLLGLRKIYTA